MFDLSIVLYYDFLCIKYSYTNIALLGIFKSTIVISIIMTTLSDNTPNTLDYFIASIHFYIVYILFIYTQQYIEKSPYLGYLCLEGCQLLHGLYTFFISFISIYIYAMIYRKEPVLRVLMSQGRLVTYVLKELTPSLPGRSLTFFQDRFGMKIVILSYRHCKQKSK